MKTRTRLTIEDESTQNEWVVSYHMGYDEFDDDPDSEEIKEVVLNAEDIDVALRYAQQYLRKMQSEEETSEEWATAEILSIERY